MIVTILLLTAWLAQAPAAAPPGADYPPGDIPIWKLQQGAQTKKDAARKIAEGLASPDMCRALMKQEAVDLALDCLKQIIDTQPSRMAEALPALGIGSNFSDGTRNHAARLRDILAAARAAAAKLPREEAAAAVYQVMSADGLVDQAVRLRWDARQAAFIQRYAGTAAAWSAEIDRYRPYADRPGWLDEIATAHAGTTIAAHALYQKAYQLGYNVTASGRAPRRDPTERFLEVIAIVKELESGKYPPSEWVTRAPSLVAGFFSYEPQYGRGNIDKVLAGYLAFVKAHFTPDPLDVLGSGTGYVIASKMGDLFKLKGDADGVDRTLRELEGEVPDPLAARYLRASYAMRNGQRGPEGERRAANLKAIEVLTALSTEGPATYARKALSTLASLRFQQGDYTAAREDYRRYVERYPQSDYAWVAALRLGEIAAVLGDWPAAHRSFEEAARVYSSNPLARIMARALAGNAAEAIGQPERALDHYDAALDAWDRDYRLEVPLQTTSPAANLLDAVLTAPRLARADLAVRAATLRATLPQPGGALLERGRWLLTRKDWTAAAAAFEELIARGPASSLVPEARLLLHRAQLEKALDLANDERSATNAAAAATMLEALEREPFDVAVAAARIARASLLSTQGKSKAAEAAMSSALNDWLQRQTLQQPGTPIERDVAAIREVVFKPMGGGIFAEAGGRNAFEWPGRLPRFLVIDPEVELKLPSGDTTSVSIAAAIPGLDNVLYADSTVLSLLDMTLNSLGGTRRRQSTPIMETPNQPVGQSMKIIALWTKFFPARPGHWGGWEFTSYPRLTRIEFLDAAHTKAAAAVTVGYSGATIVLEKQGATWKLVKVTNHWMT